jgi:hypothetical protein
MVLVEEVLMGGDAVRRSREQTVTTLAEMAEDIRLAAGDHRQDVLGSRAKSCNFAR